MFGQTFWSGSCGGQYEAITDGHALDEIAAAHRNVVLRVSPA